jgi:hypothetical protein
MKMGIIWTNTKSLEPFAGGRKTGQTSTAKPVVGGGPDLAGVNPPPALSKDPLVPSSLRKPAVGGETYTPVSPRFNRLFDALYLALKIGNLFLWTLVLIELLTIFKARHI